MNVELRYDRPYGTLEFTDEERDLLGFIAEEAWGSTDGATVEIREHGYHTLADLDARDLRNLETGADDFIRKGRAKDRNERTSAADVARIVRAAAQELEMRDLTIECPDCGHRFRPADWVKR